MKAKKTRTANIILIILDVILGLLIIIGGLVAFNYFQKDEESSEKGEKVVLNIEGNKLEYPCTYADLEDIDNVVLGDLVLDNKQVDSGEYLKGVSEDNIGNRVSGQVYFGYEDIEKAEEESKHTYPVEMQVRSKKSLDVLYMDLNVKTCNSDKVGVNGLYLGKASLDDAIEVFGRAFVGSDYYLLKDLRVGLAGIEYKKDGYSLVLTFNENVLEAIQLISEKRFGEVEEETSGEIVNTVSQVYEYKDLGLKVKTYPSPIKEGYVLSNSVPGTSWSKAVSIGALSTQTMKDLSIVIEEEHLFDSLWDFIKKSYEILFEDKELGYEIENTGVVEVNGVTYNTFIGTIKGEEVSRDFVCYIGEIKDTPVVCIGYGENIESFVLDYVKAIEEL